MHWPCRSLPLVCPRRLIVGREASRCLFSRLLPRAGQWFPLQAFTTLRRIRKSRWLQFLSRAMSSSTGWETSVTRIQAALRRILTARRSLSPYSRRFLKAMWLAGGVDRRIAPNRVWVAEALAQGKDSYLLLLLLLRRRRRRHLRRRRSHPRSFCWVLAR